MAMCSFLLFPVILLIAAITTVITLLIFKKEKKIKQKASAEGEKIDKMLGEGKISEDEAKDLKRAVGAYSIKEGEQTGDPHILVTGILHVTYGILGTFGVIISFLILSLGSFKTTMKPALCEASCPKSGISLGGGGLILLILLITAFILSEVISGIFLIKKRTWARYAIIALSIFIIFSFPFGTAIGIYSLWVLLFRENISHYFE